MPLVMKGLRRFEDENSLPERIPSGDGFSIDSLDYLEAGTYMFEVELLKDWTSFYIAESHGILRTEIICAVTVNTKDAIRNFIGCPIYLLNEKKI